MQPTTLERRLVAAPRTWVVSGAAGFVGSHLVERLLQLGQRVRAIDDFSTGSRANLAEVRAAVGEAAWSRFTLEEGDVSDPERCARVVEGADLVLHQAALGSVPRSIVDPLATLDANVQGFLAPALAAARAGVRLVFASSSSVYGDGPGPSRREERTGRPLSPYAASKRIDELLAEALAASHGLSSVGLRYFNVFGPRQDPEGPYAAVIPRWTRSWLEGRAPRVHGDGRQTRDFTPVAHVVRANLLAALADPRPGFVACNVGLGRATSLNELARRLRSALEACSPGTPLPEPVRVAPRPGDVRHSRADPERARRLLGLEPDADLAAGLRESVAWLVARRAERAGRAGRG